MCDVYVDLTSLRSHRRLNMIIVASYLMFTLGGHGYMGRCGRRVLHEQLSSNCLVNEISLSDSSAISLVS